MLFRQRLCWKSSSYQMTERLAAEMKARRKMELMKAQPVAKWQQVEMELEKPSQQGCFEEKQRWMVQCWVVHYSVAHCSLVAEAVVPRKMH
jgi:hypothetical protein